MTKKITVETIRGLLRNLQSHKIAIGSALDPTSDHQCPNDDGRSASGHAYISASSSNETVVASTEEHITVGTIERHGTIRSAFSLKLAKIPNIRRTSNRL